MISEVLRKRLALVPRGREIYNLAIDAADTAFASAFQENHPSKCLRRSLATYLDENANCAKTGPRPSGSRAFCK